MTMVGMDKKAIEKLKSLRDSEALSEAHRGIVLSMLEEYSRPDWHFFTSAQRKLIDNMHAANLEPPDRKDRQVLSFIDAALEDPNIQGYEKERIASMIGRHGRIPKKFSRFDGDFLKTMRKSLESRAEQQEVRIKLEEALNEGKVREGAEEFCRSIIAQFDERRSWSPVQMEHAEKILVGNKDPGEF